METEPRGLMRGARKTGLTVFGVGLAALLVTAAMVIFKSLYLPILVVGGMTAVALGLAMVVFPGQRAIELESFSKLPLSELMRQLGTLQQIMWTLAIVAGICAGLALHVLMGVE